MAKPEELQDRLGHVRKEFDLERAARTALEERGRGRTDGEEVGNVRFRVQGVPFERIYKSINLGSIRDVPRSVRAL